MSDKDSKRAKTKDIGVKTGDIRANKELKKSKRKHLFGSSKPKGTVKGASVSSETTKADTKAPKSLFKPLTQDKVSETETTTRKGFKPFNINKSGTSEDLKPKARRGGFAPITSVKGSEEGKSEGKAEDSKEGEAKTEGEADPQEGEAQAQGTKESLPKRVGHGFRKMFTTVVNTITAIPATLILARLLIIILILAVVVNILYSALSSLAGVLLETTAAETALMDWSNPYLDGLKTESYIDEDGSYRTMITKLNGTGSSGGGSGSSGGGSGSSGGGSFTPFPSLPGSSGGSSGSVSVSDVEFWCNITDEQIIAFLNQGTQFNDLHKFNRALNIYRAIRMAYRICYMEDENGDRYIDCEPAILLGMPQFEKGFDWMGVVHRVSAKLNYMDWCHLDNGAVVKVGEGSATSKESVRRLCNVDTCYRDIFGNDAGWKDGPYSFTGTTMSTCKQFFNTAFASAFAKGSTYNALYKRLLEAYPEYSLYADYLDPDTDTTVTDIGSNFICYLFPSMLLTAKDYMDWFNGDVQVQAKYLCNTNATYFWGKVAPAVARGIISDTSDLGKRYDYNIIFFLYCMHNKLIEATSPDDLDEDEHRLYLAYKRQTICALFYNYHHFPFFEDIYEGVVFRTNPEVTNRDENGKPKMSGYDWYACNCFFMFEVVCIAGGNLNNLDSQPYVKGCDDKDIVNSTWEPGNRGGVMSLYKGGTGAEWASYFDYKTGKSYVPDPGYENTYEAFGYYDNGIDDLIDMISQPTFGGDKFTPIYNRYTNSSLEGSVWLEVQNKCPFKDAIKADDSDTSTSYLKPLSIAAQFSRSYDYHAGNLHTMSTEGLQAYLCGGDLVDSCLTAIIIGSPTSYGDIMGDDPVTGSLNYGKQLHSILDDEVEAKMGIIPLGGKAGHLNDEGVYDGTENTILPLVDMNTEAEGVNAGDGVRIVLNTGSGYYKGCYKANNDKANSHRGLDLSHVGTADAVESYFMHNPSWGLSLSTLYSKIDNSAYIYNNCRTPVVAMADGYITRIEFGFLNSTYSYYTGSRGNSVQIKTGIRLDRGDIAAQQRKQEYMHLAPDFLAILTDSLGYDSPAEFLKEYPASPSSVYYGASSSTLNLNSYYGAKDQDGIIYTIYFSKPIPIKKGTIIGYAGNTGASDGAHLHWGTYNDMQPEGCGKYECCCFMGLGRQNYYALQGDGRTFYPFNEKWLSLWGYNNSLLTSKTSASPPDPSHSGVWVWDLENVLQLVADCKANSG